MEPQLKQQKFFPNTILRFKIQKKAKIWRKLAKKSKQRFFRLKQWRQTESNYQNKLKILKEQVRDPLIEGGIISEFQSSMMFPNLQSMIQLSQQMYNKVDGLIEGWNPLTTCLASTVNELVIYLKLYKQYSNNYLKTDAKMQELKKHNMFKKLVTAQNIQDILSKPFQRPLQYRLLISQYMRQMPTYHKDYEQLGKALKILLKISNQINQFVQSQLRSQKMVQLEKSFGNIIESSRFYKDTFLGAHIQMKCRVYVFNDLLLVAKIVSEAKEEDYMRIILSNESYIIKKQNNRIYQNMLFVCGKTENIHLVFPSLESMNTAYDLLTNTINQLYQKHFSRLEMISHFKSSVKSKKHQNKFKWKQQPQFNIDLRVNVVGLTQRMYPPNNDQIIFVLKISLGRPQQIYQLLYCTLDQLKTIENDIMKLYPKMKIPHIENKFSGLALEDFRNDLNRYYDHKSMLIESTVNFILRSKQIRRKPELVLYSLELHESFWKYINKFSHQCLCDACLQSEIFTGIDFYQKQKAAIYSKRHQFCILKSFHGQRTIAEMTNPSHVKYSIEMKLLWANCYNKRIEQSLLLPQHLGKSISFLVHLNLISEQSVIHIKTTSQSTVRSVIDIICQKQGLKTGRDLMLTFVYMGQTYYLCEDQFIMTAASFVLLKDQTQTESPSKFRSLFKRKSIDTPNLMRNTQNLSVAEDFQAKIILRKIYTFDWKLEEKICQQNIERYPIILGEILYRFKNQQMPLSIGDIKILCAFFYTIQEFSYLSMSNRLYLNEQKLKKYVPENKKNFLSGRVIEEIKQIIENQMKICQKVIYLYRCILRQFGQKLGWIYQFFKVVNKNPKTLTGGKMDLLIGLSSQKIIVTQNQTNTILLQFNICQFEFKVSGTLFFIITEEKTYQFSFPNVHLFQSIFENYKAIAELQNRK